MEGSLKVEGLDKVIRSFDRADKRVREAAMKGLQRGSMRIIADAQNNLRQNLSVVTGLLRLSGKVQKVSETELDAGFFDTTNKNSGYAFFVEYGRKAGRMPPPDELAQWAYKKFQLKDRKLARAAGWAMAVKIARKGTAPHPFFAPAIEKNKNRLVSDIREAIDRETQR